MSTLTDTLSALLAGPAETTEHPTLSTVRPDVLTHTREAYTAPERNDQIANRRKRPGRPIEFGEAQQERYRGRNVVERCFNRLKQWRGIAMRSDKLARNYRAGVALASILIWIKTDLINTT